MERGKKSVEEISQISVYSVYSRGGAGGGDVLPIVLQGSLKNVLKYILYVRVRNPISHTPEIVRKILIK